MNEFTAPYQKLSNYQLFAIVNNPKDYQTKAVEAAQQELSNRKLSQDELNRLLESFQKEQAELHVKKQNLVTEIWNNPDKIQLGLLFVTLTLVLGIFYTLYNQFNFIRFLVNEYQDGDSFVQFELFQWTYGILGNIVFVGIAIYFLRKITPSGWILTMVWFIISAIDFSFQLIGRFNILVEVGLAFNTYIQLLLVLLIIVSTIYMNKKFVLETFKINQHTHKITFLVTGLVSLILSLLPILVRQLYYGY